MYNCTMNYHNLDNETVNELTFSINNYMLAKEGADVLPELHMYYNKNMAIDSYNLLETIGLSADSYIVDNIIITDAVNNIVHSSNSWKRIIFYVCSADENSLLPQCQIRFQG